MRRCRVARPSTRSLTPTVISPRGPAPLLRAGLPDLLPDHLARVPNAFTLVGVRWAQGAQLRGGLADQVLVDAAERDGRLLVDLRRHAVRQREHDRMRVAQGEREVPSGLLDA